MYTKQPHWFKTNNLTNPIASRTNGITVHKTNKSNMRRCCGVICLVLLTLKQTAVYRLLSAFYYVQTKTLANYLGLLGQSINVNTYTWYHWRAFFCRNRSYYSTCLSKQEKKMYNSRWCYIYIRLQSIFTRKFKVLPAKSITA